MHTYRTAANIIFLLKEDRKVWIESIKEKWLTRNMTEDPRRTSNPWWKCAELKPISCAKNAMIYGFLNEREIVCKQILDLSVS